MKSDKLRRLDGVALHCRFKQAALALALVFCFSIGDCRSEAGVINLHNTGVSAAGALIPDLSVDPSYTLISSPPGSGVSAATFVVDSTKFPLNGAWMSNSAQSKWIAPQADQSTFSDDTGSGFYTYRTTFDLAKLDPKTAVVEGKWSTDNFGIDILLNGVSTGFTHRSVTPNTFSYFSSFKLESGFVSGINTVDFIVENARISGPPSGLINPTGLRVEMSGTARELHAVPEPSSLLFFGVLAVASTRRCARRRRSPEAIFPAMG